ncbi:molecular chaperone [Leclercia pneumoniae]|uniref:fimbrial biogenesis chaperone n=1 Tax=Leclercia pneumoniae TaxID=2815358 RepID=UPI002DB61FB0|nr:molecular chaperone [Leclercia pneumoniae]MEB7502437.1 molecular chaperone [Leclercia pneumoniae]
MKNILFSVILLTLAFPVTSGVMPSQSRVIFEGSDRTQSLMLVNTNSYPVVVQSWVDKGEGNPDKNDIPFVILPPVFRLEPADIKGIRIIRNQKALPPDRESLFWLNIYEMPPDTRTNKENSVLVTMNTQLKIIYRPDSVTSTSAESMKKTQCKYIRKSFIQCNNDSANYLSISRVRYVDQRNINHPVENGMKTIPPYSEFTIEEVTITNQPVGIIITLIKDAGEMEDIFIKM